MSGKAYRRRSAKTPTFGNDVEDQYYEVNSSGSNWEYYLMLLIVLLAAGALLFSIMGWHESRQGSDFAYNAEAGVFRLESDLDYLKQRELARRTCLPLYGLLAISDVPASIIISDWINTNLSPGEHRELCLFIADAAMPPAPSPPPAPTPSPMVILAQEEEENGMSLSEQFCAYFEGFPFERVCIQEPEPYLVQAICSCAPEPEMPIV